MLSFAATISRSLLGIRSPGGWGLARSSSAGGVRAALWILPLGLSPCPPPTAGLREQNHPGSSPLHPLRTAPCGSNTHSEAIVANNLHEDHVNLVRFFTPFQEWKSEGGPPVPSQAAGSGGGGRWRHSNRGAEPPPGVLCPPPPELCTHTHHPRTHMDTARTRTRHAQGHLHTPPTHHTYPVDIPRTHHTRQ